MYSYIMNYKSCVFVIVVPYHDEIQEKSAYRQILLVFAVIILSSLTLVALYLRFGLQVRVLWKDSFCKQEIDGERWHNVIHQT
jgi:hypothetical protein